MWTNGSLLGIVDLGIGYRRQYWNLRALSSHQRILCHTAPHYSIRRSLTLGCKHRICLRWGMKVQRTVVDDEETWPMMRKNIEKRECREGGKAFLPGKITNIGVQYWGVPTSGSNITTTCATVNLLPNRAKLNKISSIGWIDSFAAYDPDFSSWTS